MNKVKVKNANYLLLIVVFFITILPQIIIPLLELMFNFDFNELSKSNETFKTVLLLIDQYVFILIPVIIFIIANKLSFKEVFRLNPINLSAGVLTVLMAIAAWVVSIFTTLIVYHIYTIIIGKPYNTVSDIIPLNIYVGFFLVAITPAICEEALFRGVVLKAYENRGTVKAIVITALFFAIIHISIVRVAGPFIIAILAGYLVAKSNSIIPAVLTHMTFNGTSLCIYYITRTMPQQPERLPTMTEYFVLSIFVAFALLVIAVCIIGFNFVTTPRYNSSSKGLLFKTFLGSSEQEYRPFKKPITSISRDFVSIISSWPVILIILIFIFYNIIDIYSILQNRIIQ